MHISSEKIQSFQSTIWEYYSQHGRVMPWRNTTNQYHVFLSEVMLQQTQVSRVMTKFVEFTEKFPTFNSLSKASLLEVLSAWQGMGYNRRGKYLKESAEIIVKKYEGIIPTIPMEVDVLPGIGPATASAIVTYIYNIPTVFIETNIRRVMIYHFFPESTEIDDKLIFPFIEATLDRSKPREWYYALMDYGTFLTKKNENPNKRSKHYSVQSNFETSDRKIRGEILRQIVKIGNINYETIVELCIGNEDRANKILNQMVKEGMVKEKKSLYFVP
ncbi:MAG: A/G-specific adenine glycosylase [Candidatus Roizmanbacteria bacterium]